jgi:outer membrane lipoprotein carrier protein
MASEKFWRRHLRVTDSKVSNIANRGIPTPGSRVKIVVRVGSPATDRKIKIAVRVGLTATSPQHMHKLRKPNTPMNRVTISFLACLSVLATQPVLAQSGPARVQLEQFTTELKSLQANFDQQIINTNGLLEEHSSGQLWLAHPNRFRWHFGGDFPELLIADGEKVWLYDEVLEQVTIKEQSSLNSDSPLTLLTDITQLDEQFAVRELGGDSGLELLELRAHSQESQFERVLLGLDEGKILLMVMEDAFGLRTEIRFKDIKRNPQLNDDLFRFTPPAGVDIIGDL